MSPRAPGKQTGGGQPGADVLERPESKTRLEKPRLYKVLLHNDDYTPRQFVFAILLHVFHKSEPDASAIIEEAEVRGFAVAGVFTFEIAETKAAKVQELASEAEVPLLCTVEPE